MIKKGALQDTKSDTEKPERRKREGSGIGPNSRKQKLEMKVFNDSNRTQKKKSLGDSNEGDTPQKRIYFVDQEKKTMLANIFQGSTSEQLSGRG